ncbi:MAG: PDZ domain-containing protein [Phycisphaera sp.]|nr:PDZ domain-containing protein [Phycisphaera sp.]
MHKRKLTALLILIPALLHASPLPAASTTDSVYQQLDVLADIRHEIVSQYVEKPDEINMIEDAARAMVESLNDRFTVFLPPTELEGFERVVRGTFSGIGAEVDIHENRLRIVSPLEDSPAWKAGVMPGDIVLEVDGQSTEGMKLTDCIGKLTGEEGTRVTLLIRHETGVEETLTITRANIQVQTVRSFVSDGRLHPDYMIDKDKGIGYMRLTQFTASTTQAVRDALEDMKSQNVRGIIIDLRFNPGGLLDAAVAISDMFLPAGKTIVSIKGRVVPEKIFTATDDATLTDVPIVVIANESSASASEILTGALSDNQRALFVGTRTFGKGSVQQVRMLEGGHGAIKITNAYYYLPNGRNIHRREGKDVWGVDPSEGCYVRLTPEQRQAMVDAYNQYRKDRDSEKPSIITGQFATDTLKDPQLAAAIKAIAGKIDTGNWPQVGQSDSQGLAMLTQRELLQRQRDLLTDRLEEIDKQIKKLESAKSPPEAEAPVASEQDEAPIVPAPEDGE